MLKRLLLLHDVTYFQYWVGNYIDCYITFFMTNNATLHVKKAAITLIKILQFIIQA